MKEQLVQLEKNDCMSSGFVTYIPPPPDPSRTEATNKVGTRGLMRAPINKLQIGTVWSNNYCKHCTCMTIHNQGLRNDMKRISSELSLLVSQTLNRRFEN